MSAGSIGFDVSEIRAFAQQVSNADRIVMNELTTAFDRSGAVVLADARGNINSKTGTLSAFGEKKTTVSGTAITTVVQFLAKHAQWVEFGRQGFGPKTAKVLHFVIDGKDIFTMRVGPAKAQNFLGKSFDVNKSRIVREVEAAAARIVAKVLA